MSHFGLLLLISYDLYVARFIWSSDLEATIDQSGSTTQGLICLCDNLKLHDINFHGVMDRNNNKLAYLTAIEQ